jgi:hypothetical protein
VAEQSDLFSTFIRILEGLIVNIRDGVVLDLVADIEAYECSWVYQNVHITLEQESSLLNTITSPLLQSFAIQQVRFNSTNKFAIKSSAVSLSTVDVPPAVGNKSFISLIASHCWHPHLLCNL